MSSSRECRSCKRAEHSQRRPLTSQCVFTHGTLATGTVYSPLRQQPKPSAITYPPATTNRPELLPDGSVVCGQAARSLGVLDADRACPDMLRTTCWRKIVAFPIEGRGVISGYSIPRLEFHGVMNGHVLPRLRVPRSNCPTPFDHKAEITPRNSKREFALLEITPRPSIGEREQQP